MRKLFILLLITFLGSASYAQKYKDIFPLLVGADEENTYEILTEFLNIEPDHPNSNLRLATLYVKQYKELDVLREYEKALAYAEQAKMRLIKAKVTIDDREVKRNEEYYIGVLPDGQYSFSAVSAYIDTEYAAVEEFMTKLPPIYTEFTKSVEKYDEVVKDFSDIVGGHNSLKELYLLYDDNLGQRLASLKNNYDSTKIYFNNYLDLRSIYQVNAVEQTFTELPIKVYRLDGLVTQINFLQPSIQLWDYAGWVDSVNSVVNTNIAGLRDELIRNDKKLKDALVAVKNIENPDSFKIVRADKSLVFNLMKYDYKNSLVPYLNYQEFKQHLIVEEKRKTYFDTASITVDRKLAYFNDMMYSSKKADSIILDFEGKYDKTQLERHNEFVTEVFGSPDALRTYMVGQKSENKELFMNQVLSIKNSILATTIDENTGTEVKHRRIVIPTFIVDKPMGEIEVNYVQTKHILTSADESNYIAGHIITDAELKNTEVAIAKLSPENKVLWFKTYDFELDSAGADANHYLGDLKLTSEGVVAIIRSLAIDESQVANTLVHLTADGEDKFAKRIETELFPRELIFEERSNLFILSFFADTETMDFRMSSDLSIRGVNGLGEEIWHYDYAYSGNYLKMLTTQTQILLSGNYSLIKNEAGRTFSKPAGTNSFILALDYTGALQKIMCYASDTNYESTIFHKVSDRNLNLIGSKGEHLIVDGSLDNIYSSLTLK